MGRDNFQLEFDESLYAVRGRCLAAIKSLGWQVREDLSDDYRITCYVPIRELLPQAPVYFFSFYDEDDRTYVVVDASTDELSQSHASTDLKKLKAAIEQSVPPEEKAVSPKEGMPGETRTGSRSNNCFISYRRYDSADVVGRIYDRLIAAYGAERVFKDVDNIPVGADFRKVLNDAVTQCGVLLVVIGRDWLTVTDEHQRRRIDDASDFVRIEIEAALRNNIPVVPLLVRDATMPRESDLPDTLKELVYRHGLQIRADPDFHRDIDRLIQSLNKVFD